jgi:subtilase family serine protease
MLLLLRRGPEQEASLRKLIEDQHTEGSPFYHQWLTPAAFGKQFGPSEEDLSQVRKWLSAEGFQVNRTAAGGSVVEFSGNAGQVRSAFLTEIHKYVVANQEYWANNADPQIPAALAPVVHGIVSLHDFPMTSGKQAQLLSAVVPSGAGGIKPQFTFAASGCTTDGNCYGVAPADLATIYNFAPLWAAGVDGTGQTIAIASGSNIRPTDAHNFRQLFNLPSNDPVVFVDGGDPGIVPVEELFANFAVQWTGAVAKNATIKLVVDQSTTTTQGIDLAALYVVDNNVAPILTGRLVACEDRLGASGNVFYSVLWEQAAAEGITVVIPTGDTGSAACDSPATAIAATHGVVVNGAASTPYNVAVGGTDFAQAGIWSQFWNTTNDPTTHASAKSYIPERSYNDTCTENGPNGCQTVNSGGADLIAGGGGLSKYNTQPAWQKVSPFNLAGSRGVPDVSMFAGDGNDGSFYILCEEDAQSGAAGPACDLNPPYADFSVAGGTTGAAAAFAGIMALVNQKTGSRQGNANFVLYPLAANAASGVFHDVALGSNSVACVAGTLDCSNTSSTGYGFLGNPSTAFYAAYQGYDLSTGWGSVDANNLVTQWPTVSFLPTTTTLSAPSPASPVHGQSVSFTITVTPTMAGSGTPTGDVALMVIPPSGGPFLGDVFTLQNGSITGSTTFLPGGTYQITAHYAGDGTFGASDSAPVSITVASQPSQTVLSVPTKDSLGNLTCQTGSVEFPYGSYTLRGDVNTSGIPCQGVNTSNPPTGTVQLVLDGATPLDAGTYTLNPRAHFEDHSASISQGFHNVVATYSGDSSYGPSSGVLSILIDPALTQTSLAASSLTVEAGTSVTLRAIVTTTSVGAAPTGKVVFNSAAGAPVGSAPLSPLPTSNGFVQGIALFDFAPTNTVTISAQYQGDQNYVSSSSPSITIVSGTPDFVFSGLAKPLAINAGQTGTATLTVTPQFSYTGTVTLACPDSSSLPPGVTCAINPSTVALDSSGNPAAATVSIQTLAPSNIQGISAAVVFRPFFTLSAGIALGALVLVVGWRRRPQELFIGTIVGVIVLAGSCAGGNTVPHGGPTDSTLSLTTSAVKSPQGTPLSLTAVVSANHTVTGTVDFLDGGTPIASATGVAVVLGRATTTLSTLSIGTHSITASYSGDPNTNKSTTPSPLFQVITGDFKVPISGNSGALNHTINLNVTLQ